MARLANDMKRLVDRINEGFNSIEPNKQNVDSIHLWVCHDVCNHFELWDDNDSFPLWLSFIVAGIGRELGVLS